MLAEILQTKLSVSVFKVKHVKQHFRNDTDFVIRAERWFSRKFPGPAAPSGTH